MVSKNNNLTLFKVFDKYNISQFNKKDQKELLTMFLTDIGNKIKKVQKNNDKKELESIIHSLKGSTGNIGGYRLQQCIVQIENLLNNGKLFKNKNCLDQLQDAYLEFKSEVQLFLNNL